MNNSSKRNHSLLDGFTIVPTEFVYLVNEVRKTQKNLNDKSLVNYVFHSEVIELKKLEDKLDEYLNGLEG